MILKSGLYGRIAAILGAVTIAGAGYIVSALAEHVPGAAPLTAVHGPRLVIPIMNPMRGKKLFVSKGKVIYSFGNSFYRLFKLMWPLAPFRRNNNIPIQNIIFS